jgi:voltage-gated potassium channel
MPPWLDQDDRSAISDVAEIIVTVLSFVFLGLLVIEFGFTLSPEHSRRLQFAGWVIWAVFAIEFFVRLLFAEDRIRFFKRNWLPAIAVVLPAARVFRAAQAVRAVRTLRLARLVTGTGRGRRVLSRVFGAGGWGFVAILTVVIIFLSSAGLTSFERTAADSAITTFGEALWWTSAMLFTLGAPVYPVTLEGRLLGLLVMAYGLALSGYITASLAVLLLGLRPDTPPAGLEDLREEIRLLRSELHDRPPPQP